MEKSKPKRKFDVEKIYSMEIKKLIYLHRYPIEDESIQFPGFKKLKEKACKNFKFYYCSMKGIKPKDKELRINANFIELPFTINRNNNFDKWFKTVLYLLYFPIIWLKIKLMKPDAIICAEPLPLVPLLLAKLRIPMMIIASDWWWSITFGESRFTQFIENFEVKRWNKPWVIIIAHSNAEKNLLIRKGFSEDRIIINYPKFKPNKNYKIIKVSKEEMGFKKSDKLIVAHGIMHPSKDYINIIKCWKKIERKNSNLKLVLVGGGGEENKLKNLIKELKLKNVVLTGWLKNETDVNKYLNVADTLLVSRQVNQANEGVIPSSLYHAMALKKNILATDLPGIREFSNGYKRINFYKNNKELIKNV